MEREKRKLEETIEELSSINEHVRSPALLAPEIPQSTDEIEVQLSNLNKEVKQLNRKNFR